MCDLASTSHPTVAVFSGAFGTKAAARAAYIIPCILFFVLVSVTSKPAKKWPQHILAGEAEGALGAPFTLLMCDQAGAEEPLHSLVLRVGPTPATAPSRKLEAKH